MPGGKGEKRGEEVRRDVSKESGDWNSGEDGQDLTAENRHEQPARRGDPRARAVRTWSTSQLTSSTASPMKKRPFGTGISRQEQEEFFGMSDAANVSTSYADDQPGPSHAYDPRPSGLGTSWAEQYTEGRDDESGPLNTNPVYNNPPPQPQTEVTKILKQLLGPNSALLEAHQEELRLDDALELDDDADLFATPTLPVRSARGEPPATGLGGYRAIDVEPATPKRRGRPSRQPTQSSGESDSEQRREAAHSRSHAGRPRNEKNPRAAGRPSSRQQLPRDDRMTALTSSSDISSDGEVSEAFGSAETPVRDAGGRLRRNAVGDEEEAVPQVNSPADEISDQIRGDAEQEEGGAAISGTQRTRSGRMTRRPAYLEEFLDPNDVAPRRRRLTEIQRDPSFDSRHPLPKRQGKWVNGFFVKPQYAQLVKLVRNQICKYCHALHFEGDHSVCCYKGRVFIPPRKKLPPLLHALFNLPASRVKKEYGVSKSEFLNNILTYNTLHAFGSNTFNKLPVGRGVQSVKVQGTVTHVVSTLQPGKNRPPLFANFYVYDPERAAELRGESFLGKQRKLDKDLLNLLAKCMADYCPLVKSFKMMKDLINDTVPIAMRIVDKKDWDEQLLGHKKVYASTKRDCGDYISVLFEANLECATLPRGVTIFESLRTGMMAFPLNNWQGQIDPICYPFLFINGEGSYAPKKYPRNRWAKDEEPPTYEEVLDDFVEQQMAKEGRDVSVDWDRIDEAPPPRELTEEDRAEGELIMREFDEYVEESLEAERRRNEEAEQDLTYDQELHRQEAYDLAHPLEDCTGIRTREGYDEHYPVRDEEMLQADFLDWWFEDLEEPDERPLSNQTVDVEKVNGVDVVRIHEDEEVISLRHAASPDPDQIDLETYQPQQRTDGSEGEEDVESNTFEGQIRVDTEREDAETEGRENEMDEGIRGDLVAEEGEDEDEDPEIKMFQIRQAAVRGKPRNWVSQREHLLYITQERQGFYNFIVAAKKLGQLYLIDVYNRFVAERMDATVLHHTKMMHTGKKSLLESTREAIRRGQNEFQIGAMTSVPATVPGSARHQRMHFENIVSLSNQKGRPTWFVTFTCNVNWPEIKDHLKEGQVWADNPMLINEVFRKKLDKLLAMLYGKEARQRGERIRRPGVFGVCSWYVASIEFQQRGPPHAHIVLSVENPPQTADDVDRYCKAVLPPELPEDDPAYEDVKLLREMVIKHMIHSPCEDNPDAYCRDAKDPKLGCPCQKGFPKVFRNETQLGDNHTAELRRPDDGQKVKIPTKGINGDTQELIADNRHVVPYNEDLIMAFNCHINVLPVASGGVLHYLFKYVFKGTDRAIVELSMPLTTSDYQSNLGRFTVDGHLLYPTAAKPNRTVLQQRVREAKHLLTDLGVPLEVGGKKTVILNEARILQDLRAVTATEACWDTMGYRRYICSHTIITNFVHLEGEETVLFKKGDEMAKAERLARKDTPTKLKAWFVLNSKDDFARTLTFEELPKYYYFSKGVWKKYAHDRSKTTIGRVKSVNIRNRELYATRLLARHVKGPRSFEELRTTPGIRGDAQPKVHSTFVEAAKAQGLMDDAREWQEAIEEAAQLGSPQSTRRLFINIVSFCAVKDVPTLWRDNKIRGVLLDDIQGVSDNELQLRAIRHIEQGLEAHGMSLALLKLPTLTHLSPQQIQILDSRIGGNDYQPAEKTQDEYMREGERRRITLNPGQASAFKQISHSVLNDKPQVFMLNGSAGTGKTYLYEALYNYLMGKGKKVMCVAHTGIAASLLPYGQTAHRAFGIPINFDTQSECQIKHQSKIAQQLEKVDMLIWDEISMTDYRLVDAVDRFLATIAHSSLPFGGRTVVFGGDMKQCLPIITGLYGNESARYTLQHSQQLWHQIKQISLTENQRAKGDPAFVSYIENIGYGREWADKERQLVRIPKEMLVESEDKLLEDFYDSNRLSATTTEELKQLPVVLTPDNKSSLELNEKILDKLDEEERTYYSVDSHNDTFGLRTLDPEAYHDETPSGMPTHRLRLKKNSLVILLKNLSVAQGLCNGTRMRILELKEKIIICEPLFKGFNSPDYITLPRCIHTPINVGRREFAFNRLQFPVRLAYSMTINKAQGQEIMEQREAARKRGNDNEGIFNEDEPTSKRHASQNTVSSDSDGGKDEDPAQVLDLLGEANQVTASSGMLEEPREDESEDRQLALASDFGDWWFEHDEAAQKETIEEQRVTSTPFKLNKDGSIDVKSIDKTSDALPSNSHDMSLVAVIFNVCNDSTITGNPRKMVDIWLNTAAPFDLDNVYRLELYGTNIGLVNEVHHGKAALLNHVYLVEGRLLRALEGKFTVQVVDKLCDSFASLFQKDDDHMPSTINYIIRNSSIGFVAKVVKVGDIVEREKKVGKGKYMVKDIDLEARDGHTFKLTLYDRSIAIADHVIAGSYYSVAGAIRRTSSPFSLQATASTTVDYEVFDFKSHAVEIDSISKLERGKYFKLKLIVATLVTKDDDGVIKFGGCDPKPNAASSKLPLIQVNLVGVNEEIVRGGALELEFAEVASESGALLVKAEFPHIKLISMTPSSKALEFLSSKAKFYIT